jgi:DNA-binding GntR family transcriptional regulator
MMSTQRPIERRPRDVIEDEIVAGDLQPGARLDESMLAARFGVSRTPIREAIQQLAAMGLVEIRPRRGAVVALLGPEQLYEMFEVMAELEAMAGRLAARRQPPEERDMLLTSHAACGAACNDVDAYYLENEAFHQVIYRAAGTAFLHQQCVALQKRLSPYRRMQLRVGNRVSVSLSEHGAIVDAIIAGDAPAAADQLRAHIVVQGARFADLVASLRRMQVA